MKPLATPARRRADRRQADRTAGRGRCRPGLRAGTAVAAGCLALAGCGAGGSAASSGPSSPSTAASGPGTWLDRPVSASVLDLPLVDSTGHTTSLRAFRGKVLVINGMMTLCQETCPMDTANVVEAAADAARDGAGADVEFLSITVDPARDTPAQLSAYRKLFGSAPADWKLLTGSPATVAKLWSYFGVWYQRVPEGKPPATDWRTGQPLTYDVDHADQLILVDAAGHERDVIDGAGHVEPGTHLPAKLRAYLDAQGVQNLEHPGSDTWTVGDALDATGRLLGRTLRQPHN